MPLTCSTCRPSWCQSIGDGVGDGGKFVAAVGPHHLLAAACCFIICTFCIFFFVCCYYSCCCNLLWYADGELCGKIKLIFNYAKVKAKVEKKFSSLQK